MLSAEVVGEVFKGEHIIYVRTIINNICDNALGFGHLHII